MSNVGYATLQIIPSTQGFGTALNRGVDPASRDAGTRGGRAMGGTMLAGFGKAFAPIAGIMAGAGLVSGIKSVVDEASSLNESINAVNVTFGKSAAGIHALGKQAAESVGLSRNEFNGLAVQFSAFATSIAGPGGNVAKTLDSITTRAADFASVMDLEVADAARLFQSGLAGETEPLRKFGIDLSAAAVEAFAYANGIAKAGETLTENQKVQARYGLLMKSTQKTQGDFANTSDSLANAQRTLGANFKDAKAALGTAFLPVLAKGTTALRDLFAAGGPVSGLIAKVGPLFSSAGNGAGLFTRALAFVRPYIEQLRAVALPVFNQIKAVLKTVFEDSAPIIRFFGQVFQVVFPLIFAQVKFVMSAIANVIRGALQIVQGIIQVFSGLLTGNWGKVWEGIKNIVLGALRAVWGLFNLWFLGRILGVAKSLIGRLLPLFGAAMRGLGSLVMSGLRAIFGLFRAAPSAIVRALASLAGALGRVALAAMRFMLNGARGGANAVFSFFKGLPGKIGSFLASLPAKMLAIGGNIMSGIARGITGKAGEVIAAIKRNVTDALPGFVKKALGIHSPSRVFRGFGENIAQGLAIGINNGKGDVLRAMGGLTSATEGSVAASVGGSGAGPLVGSLTLQSGGSVRDDLAEVDFYLRRASRGGIRA